MMTQSAKMRGAVIVLYFAGTNNYLYYTVLLTIKQTNIYAFNYNRIKVCISYKT